MADGDIKRLSTRWEDPGGNDYVNTFHFRETGVVAGDPNAALAADFLANVVDTYKVPVSSNLSINLIRVEDVVPGTAASYELIVSPAQAGSTTGDMLPPQDSAVVSIKTALKGRSYRGRLFYPPTGEGNNVAGVLQSGYVTAIENFLSDLNARYITNVATSKFRWVVVSRYLDGAERGTPVATDVTSWAVRPSFKTLRRRQLGVGA